jgi:cell division protein FtsN
MRVTCPKCQCKGLIDSAPLLSKAHVTCARCGLAFEALLVDGIIETEFAAEPTEVQPDPLVAQPQAEPQAEFCGAPLEADEVLALPQVFEPVEPDNEPAGVLEIFTPAQPEKTVAVELSEPVRPLHLAVASVEPNAAQIDLADSGAFEMPADYEPQFSRAEIAHVTEQDKYSLGVRLMRVSPMWLLACGLAFIALVVVLNGLTSSAVQLDSATAQAARPNAPGNHSTNQAAHTAAPDQTARPMSAALVGNKSERAQETAQQSPAGLKNNNTQAAQVAVVQPTPQAEMPRKQVEAKPAPAPVPTPQPEGAGRFTLQVGSFNTPVEANERAGHLQAAGFASRVVAVELPGRGTWYRVQTGRFSDRVEAARAGAQLRAKGAAESFIVSEVTTR